MREVELLLWWFVIFAASAGIFGIVSGWIMYAVERRRVRRILRETPT